LKGRLGQGPGGEPIGLPAPRRLARALLVSLIRSPAERRTRPLHSKRSRRDRYDSFRGRRGGGEQSRASSSRCPFLHFPPIDSTGTLLHSAAHGSAQSGHQGPPLCISGGTDPIGPKFCQRAWMGGCYLGAEFGGFWVPPYGVFLGKNPSWGAKMALTGPCSPPGGPAARGAGPPPHARHDAGLCMTQQNFQPDRRPPWESAAPPSGAPPAPAARPQHGPSYAPTRPRGPGGDADSTGEAAGCAEGGAGPGRGMRLPCGAPSRSYERHPATPRHTSTHARTHIRPSCKDGDGVCGLCWCAVGRHAHPSRSPPGCGIPATSRHERPTTHSRPQQATKPQPPISGG
jgi:hypothetical protein